LTLQYEKCYFGGLGPGMVAGGFIWGFNGRISIKI